MAPACTETDEKVDHIRELKLPGVHLVKAWQNRPPTVAVDREHRGIVPGIPSTMAHMAGRERLPALDMGGPTGEGGQAQGFLPGLEPERTALVPALPLAVLDALDALAPGPDRTGEPDR